MAVLKRLPFHEFHRELGARFVEFAGYEMPVQYSSVIEEHLAVRKKAGIFDVSHMAPMRIWGNGVMKHFQYICSNNLNVEQGRARYTLVLNEKGGVRDDIIVYREEEEKFLLVANAANAEKIKNYLSERLPEGSTVDFLRDRWCILSVQGPEAVKISSSVFNEDAGGIKRWHFRKISFKGKEVVLARTGYTGEDGVEILCEKEIGSLIFKELMKKKPEIVPCGLGARDSLRLEKGLPLYGHELNEERTPIESSLERFVFFENDFLARDILLKQLKEGVQRKIKAAVMLDSSIPRENYPVKTCSGDGYVTSGGYSPILRKGICLLFVPSSLKEGDEIEILIRGKPHPARVVPLPFV